MKLIIIFLFISTLFAKDSDILWPLKCKPALTSMFGSYRSGHFHSGTDMKTWGKVGIPIVSEDDGYIYRISVSTRGYGKALYVKLKNGEYRVYGHLNNFSKKIERLIKKEQYRVKSYSVKMFFKKNQIIVKKGEVIAKSGDTGVGYPHLHFECRTKKNIPYNPLSHKHKASDTRSPVPSSIVIKPLKLGSTVNGSFENTFIKLQQNKKGIYTTKEAVQIYGSIGIGIKATDKADAAGNSFSVYSNELYFDDSLIFKCSYDSFNFNETKKIHLDYDLLLIRNSKGRYNNLFLEPGNTLPFYDNFKISDGLIENNKKNSISPGVHEIKIISKDIFENKAITIFNVFYLKPPVVERVEYLRTDSSNKFLSFIEKGSGPIEAVTFSTSKDGKLWKTYRGQIVSKNNYYSVNIDSLPKVPFYIKTMAKDSNNLYSLPYIMNISGSSKKIDKEIKSEISLSGLDNILTVKFNINMPLMKMPDIHVTIDNNSLPIFPLQSNKINEYVTKFRCNFKSKKRVRITISIFTIDNKIKTFHRDYNISGFNNITPAEAISIDKKSAISIANKSVFKHTLLWLENFNDTTIYKKWEEINYINGSAYTIYPKIIYYDKPIKIKIYSKKLENTGIFTSMGKLGWQFNSLSYDSINKFYYGKIKENIPFALFTDKTAPKIKRIFPKKKNQKTKKRQLILNVKDGGSGIQSDDNIITTLDGKWILNEYDFETGRVLVDLRGIKRGKHALHLKAKDNLNNESEIKINFTLL